MKIKMSVFENEVLDEGEDEGEDEDGVNKTYWSNPLVRKAAEAEVLEKMSHVPSPAIELVIKQLGCGNIEGSIYSWAQDACCIVGTLVKALPPQKLEQINLIRDLGMGISFAGSKALRDFFSKEYGFTPNVESYTENFTRCIHKGCTPQNSWEAFIMMGWLSKALELRKVYEAGISKL